MRKGFVKTALVGMLMVSATWAPHVLEARAYNHHHIKRHSSGDLHVAYEIEYRSCLLTLEDGSQWKVAESDYKKLAKWYHGDTLAISANYSSSYYTYYLINQHTEAYVRANIVNSPIRGSEYAVTIQGFDRSRWDQGAVHLSNGTFWSVRASHMHLIKNWYIDDLVIIGHNSVRPQKVMANF